jgi:hypothetical protein
MNAKRPNQQLRLPFEPQPPCTRAEAGEARFPSRQGVEASTTPSGSESPAPSCTALMEAICSPQNLPRLRAVRR